MVNYLQVFAALLAPSLVLALPSPAAFPAGFRSDPLPAPKYERRNLTLDRRQSQLQYANEAVTGINVLSQWYGSNGLWNNEWWNSANIITMLADLQVVAPSQVEGYNSQIFPHTFANAPSWGAFTGFINQFYDDELWWCLAWIAVYDVTGNAQYINMAASIFENAKNAWGQPSCGGLYWEKPNIGVNAIENELYITAAAKLANRLPSTPSGGYYFNEAIKSFAWFHNSGLINSEFLINDGLDTTTCKNNGNPTWSYNQGVILSGLTELTWSTGDESYTNLAVQIAEATITHLTNSAGILVDPCGDCGGDSGQFKGVFARNLAWMYTRADGLSDATKAKFQSFLQTNANSLWTNDQSGGYLGPLWQGPYEAAGVNTQSSALDLLVAAAAVT